MVTKELLDLLVCPETHAPLEYAADALLTRMNHAIARGWIKNRAGQTVERRIDAGLVRADQKVLYPIVDGIPMMLVDEGIPLDGHNAV